MVQRFLTKPVVLFLELHRIFDFPRVIVAAAVAAVVVVVVGVGGCGGGGHGVALIVIAVIPVVMAGVVLQLL